MVPPSVLQLGQFNTVQNNLSNNGPSLHTLTKNFVILCNTLVFLEVTNFTLNDHVMSLTLCTILCT